MKNLLIFLLFPYLSFGQLFTSVDGRMIQLNADMTWEYYRTPASDTFLKNKPPKKKKADLNFVMEEVPVFPGCENEIKQKLCFQNKIQKHIAENFKYPKLALQDTIQGRVYMQFMIDVDGSIVNIKTRGPNPHLEAETYRLAKLLPKMKLGKLNGKPISVPFSIPVNFRLE